MAIPAVALFRGQADHALSASVKSENGMGQHYIDANHPVVRRAVELAQEIGAKDVLDLGTGRGITALNIAAEAPGAKVLATDINEVGLQELRQKALAGGLPIETQVFNAASKTLPEGWHGRFDLVVAKDVYPFLTPQQGSAFLRNAAGALKPGGWFLMTAPSTRSSLYKGARATQNPFYRGLWQGAKEFIQTVRNYFGFTSIRHLSARMEKQGLEMTEANHFGREKGWIMALAQKRTD